MANDVMGPTTAPKDVKRVSKNVEKIMDKYDMKERDRAVLEEVLEQFMTEASLGRAFTDWITNSLTHTEKEYCDDWRAKRLARSRVSATKKKELTPLPERLKMLEDSLSVPSPSPVRRLFTRMSPRSRRSQSPGKPSPILMPRPPSVDRLAEHLPHRARANRQRNARYKEAQMRHEHVLGNNLRKELQRAQSFSR